jgi:hypothetical protein
MDEMVCGEERQAATWAGRRFTCRKQRNRIQTDCGVDGRLDPDLCEGSGHARHAGEKGDGADYGKDGRRDGQDKLPDRVAEEGGRVEGGDDDKHCDYQSKSGCTHLFDLKSRQQHEEYLAVVVN